jgi:hypothetical protein
MANYTEKKKKSFYIFCLSVNNLLDDEIHKRKNRYVWRLLALCSKTKNNIGSRRQRERERGEKKKNADIQTDSGHHQLDVVLQVTR